MPIGRDPGSLSPMIHAEDVLVADLDARGFQDVASFAPARVLLLGVAQAVFGLLVALMGVLAVWAVSVGDLRPTEPGDLPAWWMSLVGVALALYGFYLVSGGRGRMVSAFARSCYFKAGPEGIAVRLPKPGWFGIFKVVEYTFSWQEIKRLEHFTHRSHMIPSASELRIELENGETIAVQRHYFSAGVEEVRQRLLAIRSMVGR